MNVLMKYVPLALVLTLCMSIGGSYEELVTVCKTYDPDKESLPKCEGGTVTVVESRDQHGGLKPVDECQNEQIQKITEKVLEEILKNFTTRLDRLSEQIEEATNSLPTTATSRETSTAPFRNGFRRLDDGWIGLPNGYQYKLPNSTQNYEEGRQLCQRMGADLAVYGVRDLENRRILDNALNPLNRMYIGMNDIAEEGTWRWINGDLASDAEALWRSGQPDGGEESDCAAMNHDNFRSYDGPCSWPGYYALCEKRSN